MKDLIIDWKITNRCNFKCSYCLTNNGINDRLTKSVIVGFINKQSRKIHLELTGGEPTLFKDLDLLLSEVTCSTSITTNGSKSIEWWNGNLQKLSRCNISFHNGKSNLEHLIKISKIPRSNHLHFHILMIPEFFDKLVDIAKTLQETSNTVNLVSLRDPIADLNSNGVVNYTDKQLEVLNNQANMLNSDLKYLQFHLDILNKRNYVGRKCSMGKDYIVIDELGNVKPAWCTNDFIGNICEFKLFNSEMICDKVKCPCFPGEMPTCTKDSPYPDTMYYPKAKHPDSKLIDTIYAFNDDENNYEVYECPNCKTTFKVTLASH